MLPREKERHGKEFNVNRKQDLLIAYLKRNLNAIELASIFGSFDVNEGEIVEAA